MRVGERGRPGGTEPSALRNPGNSVGLAVPDLTFQAGASAFPGHEQLVAAVWTEREGLRRPQLPRGSLRTRAGRGQLPEPGSPGHVRGPRQPGPPPAELTLPWTPVWEHGTSASGTRINHAWSRGARTRRWLWARGRFWAWSAPTDMPADPARGVPPPVTEEAEAICVGAPRLRSKP